MQVSFLKGLPEASFVSINAKDARRFSLQARDPKTKTLADVPTDASDYRPVDVRVKELREAIEVYEAVAEETADEESEDDSFDV